MSELSLKEYDPEDLKRIRKIQLDLFHKLLDVCQRYDLKLVTGFGTTLGAVRHKGYIPWDDDMDFLMPRKDYEKLIKVAAKEFKGKYELLEPRLTDDYVMTFAKLSRKDSTFLESSDMHVRYNSGIYIDIFPMDFWPQDEKKRNKVAFKCYLLARLCSVAAYKRPKLPEGMPKWKKRIIYAVCGAVHFLLKISGLTTRKLYKRYRYFASVTSPEDAEYYVTDMTWCWIRKYGKFGKYGMFGLQYKYDDLFETMMMEFEDDKVPVPVEYDKYLTTAYRDYMTLPPVENRHLHYPEILIFPEED